MKVLAILALTLAVTSAFVVQRENRPRMRALLQKTEPERHHAILASHFSKHTPVVFDFASDEGERAVNNIFDTEGYTKEPVVCHGCPSGKGVTRECTLTAPTLCVDCGYDEWTPRDVHFKECQQCSTCGSGMYARHSCTATSDTVCDLCFGATTPIINDDYKNNCVALGDKLDSIDSEEDSHEFVVKSNSIWDNIKDQDFQVPLYGNRLPAKIYDDVDYNYMDAVPKDTWESDEEDDFGDNSWTNNNAAQWEEEDELKNEERSAESLRQNGLSYQEERRIDELAQREVDEDIDANMLRDDDEWIQETPVEWSKYRIGRAELPKHEERSDEWSDFVEDVTPVSQSSWPSRAARCARRTGNTIWRFMMRHSTFIIFFCLAFVMIRCCCVKPKSRKSCHYVVAKGEQPYEQLTDQDMRVLRDCANNLPSEKTVTGWPKSGEKQTLWWDEEGRAVNADSFLNPMDEYFDKKNANKAAVHNV